MKIQCLLSRRGFFGVALIALRYVRLCSDDLEFVSASKIMFPYSLLCFFLKPFLLKFQVWNLCSLFIGTLEAMSSFHQQFASMPPPKPSALVGTSSKGSGKGGSSLFLDRAGMADRQCHSCLQDGQHHLRLDLHLKDLADRLLQWRQM